MNDAFDDLNYHENELALLIVRGLSNKAASEKLGVSLSAVKNRLTIIYRKLDVCSRMELTRLYISRKGQS